MNAPDLTALTEVHPAMSHFTRQGSVLCVAGKPVTEWAAEADATPVFVYDSSVVKKQIKLLREHLPGGMKISYAIKANPYAPLVEKISAWVDGFDVASLQELDLALNQNIDAAQISFAGPGKSLSGLRRAIESGVIINVESTTEIQRCVDIGQTLGIRPKVCIRLNPGLDVRASGMKMSSAEGSPFGIDFEQLPAILRDFPVQALELLGFHVYGCSQQLDASILLEYFSSLMEQLEKLVANSPVPIQQINLGGGFGIPYFPSEVPIDLNLFGGGIKKLLDKNQAWLQDTEIKMEFGRFLVGEAGVYLCRVVDIKESGSSTYVIVDGGMHHHLANAGLLGQVVRRNFPTALANKMDQAKDSKVHICGPLCTPLDRVASAVELPPVAIGDLVAIFSSGAYGLTASPTGFLSQPMASEILC